jgi:uncharacterized protein (DUF433 family)
MMQLVNLAIVAEPVPLTADPTGTIRVGATRVTLDSVVAAYHEGFSAEEIAEQYPTLALADVHATVAYYLRHRHEVDQHLAERQVQGARLRIELEARHPSRALRERLIARQHDQRAR